MSENASDDASVAALSVSAGAVAGAVATSGTAVTAAGAGAAGFSGYVAGVSVLAAHAACETAAAVGLGAVIAGPLMGAFLGFTAFHVGKCVVSRCKARNNEAAKAEEESEG
jgi:hypothetical protein